jgi:hypothetical protein
MALEDKVHAFRLRLFRRAEELGTVTLARDLKPPESAEKLRD